MLVQFSVAQQVITVDEDTKEPIANVAFFNADKSTTALSDIDGVANLTAFSINEIITVQHLSYHLRRGTKKQLLKRGNELYLSIKAEQLDEVVMSISKWEQQKKDIPQKIVSIDAKAIAFTNPQTAADLLQQNGQVFVQKSQLGGGSPMIRGFATNRLLLSVDGVRMNNAIFRGGNVQNVIAIDPYVIQNTEVVFGPGSVIYGSDAIGGVLNFYTKTPKVTKIDTTRVAANFGMRYSSAADEKTIHADAEWGTKKWAFLTSVTHNDFGDLRMGKHGPEEYLRNTFVKTEDGTDVLVQNPDPRNQRPTGYQQLNVMQKVVYQPKRTVQVKMGAYYSESSDYSRYDRLVRPSTDGLGLRSAEWYYGPQKWFMGNVQLYHKGKNSFYDGMKFTTAYQRFEESRNDRDFQATTLHHTEEKVDAFSANIDFETKRLGALSLYYGAEFVHNNVYSIGSQSNIVTQVASGMASRYPDNSVWETAALYVNSEYKAKPNFNWLSGLRYSHVWINAPFDTTYFDFPFNEAKLSTGALTGSIGFSWFPKENLQFTFNGSTGFRAPNIDDIGKVFDSEPGAVVVPNPDLEPEYAYNVELGIQRNIKDKVVFKATTFYTYLVDALVRRDFTFNGANELVYNGELSRVQAIQNAAKAYVYGLELGFDAYLSDQWSVNSNLTITEGIEEDDAGNETPARHVAPTFGDVHLIWKNQNWKADAFVAFNGEISNENLAPSEQSKAYIYAQDANGNPYSPSWYTLNIRSHYQVSSDVKISAILENITNQRYRSYSSGIVAPGSNLILSISYQL